MPSIASLLAKINNDHSQRFSFIQGDQFRWSSSTQEITYNPTDANAKAHILHELSHALLGHSEYERDIQLIGLERDAWHYAAEKLSFQYASPINNDVIQDSLDTYRDWLHARSTCPSCQATGLQIKKQLYKCIACHNQWRVNDARICGLRRQSITP